LFTIIWGLAWCLIDRLFPLLPMTRGWALGLNAAVVIAMLAAPMAAMLRPVDADAAAAEIERREPAWSQRLETVTSRMNGRDDDDDDDDDVGASDELLAALATQVADEARGRDATRLVSWRPVARPAMACATWLALAAMLSLSPWLDLPTLARRYATPWRDVRPVTTTRLLVMPGDAEVTAGERLRVQAAAVRLGEGAVTLHVRAADAVNEPWHVEPMTATLDGRFEATLERVDRDLDYFVRGGDARSETFRVTMLPRPAVRRFRVRYVYPPHTGLASREAEADNGAIEAPVGTQVTLVVEPTRPLSYGVMTAGAESTRMTPDARTGALLTSFLVNEDRRYTLRMVSDRGVSGVFRGGTIRAIADRPPIVQLRDNLTSRDVGGGDVVSVGYQVVDDYGLSRLDAEVRIVRRSGAEANASIGAPLSRVGVREQAGVVPIALRRFGLNAGDVVELRLQAEDRGGQFGHSGVVRLVVTSSPAPAGEVANEAAVPATTAAAAVESALPATPPVEPAGYGDSIRAYFERVRADSAKR
jgi:hypothetical protein